MTEQTRADKAGRRAYPIILGGRVWMLRPPVIRKLEDFQSYVRDTLTAKFDNLTGKELPEVFAMAAGLTTDTFLAMVLRYDVDGVIGHAPDIETSPLEWLYDNADGPEAYEAWKEVMQMAFPFVRDLASRQEAALSMFSELTGRSSGSTPPASSTGE